MTLLLWEHQVPILDSEEWVLVDVEVDLVGAVTVVATASADIAKPVAFGNPPPHSFGYAVTWALQDSLTGADWHFLAGGDVSFQDPRQIRRISSPVGTSMRLGLRARVLATMSGEQRAPTQDADGWHHIWSAMQLARPTDIRVNLAVRSL